MAKAPTTKSKKTEKLAAPPLEKNERAPSIAIELAEIQDAPIRLTEILGGAPILPGEDGNNYAVLLRSVAHSMVARDLVEALLIKDIANTIWELESIQRLKSQYIGRFWRKAVREEMTRVLSDAKGADASLEAQVTLHRIMMSPNSYSALRAWFDAQYEELDAVLPSAFYDQLFRIERWDSRIACLEAKRDRLIRDLEKRRCERQTAPDMVLDIMPEPSKPKRGG